ncbi:hypothetical protein TNCV_2138511 [Trichonephila clavipes]|nr:hypothetical protein TNCV_2138511 [Trichonephila clavipes]
MGYGLECLHCRPSTFRGNWESPELRRCKPVLGFNFAENTQAKQTLYGSLTCRIILRHDAVDIQHQENPPTWAGVARATLGAESQQQTNHATQPARDNTYYAVNLND